MTFLQKVVAFVSQRKIQLTLVYFAAFMALGLALASLGPSIPDLRLQTNTTLATQSFVGAARAAGYLAGAAVGGPIVDVFPGNRVMAAALAAASVGTAVVPVAPTAWMEGLFIITQGLAMGFLDAGANLMLIYLHGSDVNPYMQSMHFFFALGAFLAPLLVKLAQDSFGAYRFAWWIISVFMIPVIISLLFFDSPKDASRHAQQGEADPESTPPAQSTAATFPAWTRAQWGIVSLTAAFLFFYVGCEVATSNLLVSFVEDRKLADRDTAYSINATFWGALALFRLIAVPLSLKMAPISMLYLNFVIGFVGLSLMGVGSLPAAESLSLFWIGCFGWGAALASSFPTALNLAESLMPLTGSAGSIFMVGASAGEFIIPALLGYLQGASPPDRPSNALIVGSFVVSLAMVSTIVLLRIFFYSEPAPAAPQQHDKVPDESRRPPMQPSRISSSPRPILPIQVRLASQSQSAHEHTRPRDTPTKRSAPIARQQIASKPNPGHSKGVSKSESDALDDEDDEFSIPGFNALFRAPPSKSISRLQEYDLESAHPLGRQSLPAIAVAMRQSSIARHADDLGRVWLTNTPSQLPVPAYMKFHHCHSAFAPAKPFALSSETDIEHIKLVAESNSASFAAVQDQASTDDSIIL